MSYYPSHYPAPQYGSAPVYTQDGYYGAAPSYYSVPPPSPLHPLPIQNAEISLYEYDLSNTVASHFSTRVPAVWHTSIVAFGYEVWFGWHGINVSNEPNTQDFGSQPQRRVFIEAVDPRAFFDLIGEAQGPFRRGTYHLLHHNCNTFTDWFLRRLINKGIPPYITSLPHDFLATPLGKATECLIERMYKKNDAASSTGGSKSMKIIAKTGRAVARTATHVVPHFLS